MYKIKSKVTIDAPKELVFKTISDINNFSKAVPDILEVEFLSDKHAGVGTRFRETRLMKGKKVSSVLEITEYVENSHIRIISNEGGTVWDSIFTVNVNNKQVDLMLVMEAKPHNIFARLLNILIKGMLQRALDSDMANIKKYCEKEA